MSTFKRIVACFFAVLMMVTSMPVTGLAAIADSAEQAIAEAKSHAIIEEATKEKPETSATKTEISEKTTGNSEETKAEEGYKTQDVEMKKYGSTVSPSNTNIVYGKDGFLTRAEWLHNLAVIFSMEVEEESLPDNYFSDIETSHKYYKDILLTVEFGVVDIEAGGKIRPDDMATRDFAVSTLNFCLGYRLEEGTEYTFGDADTCLDADSAQIAINRGWTPLIGGNFSPAAYLTTVEAEKMVKDAQASVAGQEIDASYENNYVFAEGIIVIPDGTQAFETANGIVNITDCPETIEVGNKFAVYYSGVPVVYTAQKVSVVDNVTIIETQSVKPNDAFSEVDAEGVVGSESMSLIPADGVDVWFEEEAVTPYALKTMKNISSSTELTLIPGLTAKVEVKIKNPRVEYQIKAKKSYVMFKGDTEITYELKGDIAEAALGDRELKLCDVPIGGIGSFEITVELEFSGAASGVVEGTLNAGVEVVKGDGFRSVKTFKQKYFSSNVEATISAGLMAKLGVTKLPIVEAYIFVEAGLKANLKSTTYSDETAPHRCVHFAAYLYANYGAVASAEFLGWKKEYKLECVIYDDSNSPVRIVHHYEDGQKVAECTKGQVSMPYFTPSTSKGDNTGWSGGNHSYGLQKDGTPVKLYEYNVDAKNDAIITKYLGNSWTVNVPSTIDGHTVVTIGPRAFERKSVGNVILPNTVTCIDYNAFYECHNLRSITLSKNIVTINNNAFEYCSSLTSIELPNALTEINYAVFAGTGLKSVNIPDSVTSISSYAFANCQNLATVTLSDKLEYIGNYAFENCVRLNKVTIPDNVTRIDTGAFKYCTSLSSVVLSKKLETLGGQAFMGTAISTIEIPKSLDRCETSGWDWYNIDGKSYQVYFGPFFDCTELKTVTFEAGADQVAQSVFEGCMALEEVVIPDTVTVIEGSSFSDCHSLKKLTIGSAVTTIGSYAFESCLSLEEVTIPNSVTELDYGSFSYCSALKEIVIPDSVTVIDNEAFKECSALSKVVLSKNLEVLGGQAFTRTAISTIEIPASLDRCNTYNWDWHKVDGISYQVFYGPFFDCPNLKTATFENGTTQIAQSVFEGCMTLEEVVIPDTVTEIENSSFCNCHKLKKVTFGKALTRIYNNSFCNCLVLDNVVLPDSLTTIDYSAFEGCKSLKDLTFSINLTTIGNCCFKDCVSLAEIVLPKYLTNLGGQAFTRTAISTIEIPATLDRCDTYNWDWHKVDGKDYQVYYGPFFDCENLKTVTFEEGITQIAQHLFNGCMTLEKVVIPDTVTVIENGAFEDCHKLTDITVGKSVTTIGHNTFDSCLALESIELPNGLTEMANYAFASCKKLKNITLPDSLTDIGLYAFKNCSALTKINIPVKLKYIQNETFADCSALEEVFFPEDSALVRVENYAFSKCTALKEINLPENLENIYDYAFQNCTGLEKVYIPQSTKNIGRYVFMGCTSLNNPTISDYSISTIEAQTFMDCPGLVEVTLPKGLKTIESQAFVHATNLKKIVIPESVTSIDASAFSYPETMVIYGKKGSYAETFATENKFKFVDYSIPAEGISLIDGIEKITLERGESYRAVFEFFPENSTDVITLTSDNNCVTIDGHDIYARYSGTSTITARASSGVDYVFTITVIDVSSITIEKEPTKLAYYMGEELDLTGMVVKVNYNDKSSKEVTDYTVSGFDSSVEGECTVTVQWTSVAGYNYKKTFKTTIIDPRPKVTGIYVDTLPNKVDYARKESLDLTGMVIKANYTDGTSKAVTEYTVSGYNALKNGVQTVTVNFEGFTTTFNVTVGLTLQSVEIATKPNKTVYYIGEALETKGLTLNATYSDGTVKTIESGFTVSGFSSASVGTKTVKVTFNGMEVSFNVTVKAVKITLSSTSLALTAGETATLTATTAPEGQTVSWKSTNTAVATVENGKVTAVGAGDAKIEATFTYGELTYKASCIVTVTEVKIELVKLTINTLPENGTLYIGDSLNTGGLVLKAEYSDGSTKLVESGFAVSGYDSATAGEKTVVVSYMGKEVTFNVTVNAPSVTISSNSLALTVGGISTLTATTSPDGQTVSWKSTNTAVVTVENGKVTAVGAGDAKIEATFTYGDITYKASCIVTVTEVKIELVKLTINTLPENGTLYIGDSLNTDGLVLKAEYSDGSAKLIESGFAVSGYDSATAGEKTVVVSYMGKEVTFKVTVNAPSVSITSGADSIIIGEKLTLTATVEPKHLAISWKSSNEKIATVDKGVVTGISVGSVTVTASVSYNGKTYSAEYAITVKTNVIESNAKLTIDNVTAKAGETVEMLFVLSDAPQLKALGIENIIFDETKLELVNGEWLVGGALLDPWDNDTKSGVVALAANKDINGNVFKLTLRVKDNVEECDIDVSCKFVARQKQAAGGEAEVGVEVIKGVVSVRNVLKGDTNSDGFVDSDDAVYLLYNVLFGEDAYPLAQNCDFNADGFVDSDDAIYLLYNILFGEDGYPLH